MLAQVHEESQNSDSFWKSGYNRKVSGGAKSATDLGGLSGRQGQEKQKKSFTTLFSICSLCCLGCGQEVSSLDPGAGLLETPAVLPRGGSSHRLPESETLSVEKGLFV